MAATSGSEYMLTLKSVGYTELMMIHSDPEWEFLLSVLSHLRGVFTSLVLENLFKDKKMSKLNQDKNIHVQDYRNIKSCIA